LATQKNKEAKLVSILPIAYAMVGTFYLALQLSNLYPDISINNFKYRTQQPLLFAWASLSLLFWIPAFSKKPKWSVLHSLVFFFLIVKDLFFYIVGSLGDQDVIKNDMRVYTVSILLNLAAFVLLLFFTWLLSFRNKYPES
jgi:hypothetical protein